MASTTELVTESVADLTLKKDDEFKKEKTFAQLTTKEKIAQIREVITVEPLIAAYVLASILCGPALIYLEFEKSCRVNLNLNDTVCDSILTSEYTNYTAQNDEIQILISDMHSWQQPMQSVMPLILVLFLGSYSDRHKWRKPFLLLPILGEFFAVAGCILCVVFMRSWPLEAQGVMQTVVPSFFGGQTMIVMAVFAYIADVSTIEMRTLRVGVVQIVLNVCTPLGQSVSGILFQQLGYYGMLGIAAGLYLFAFCYGLFCIKEPKIPIKTSERGILMDIFDPRHAIDTFSLMLRKKKGNNRLYIFLVLLTLFVYSGVVVGEGSVVFFYLQSVFKWTVVEYSYFLTMNTLVHLIGTILAVPLFTKVLNLSDMVIILLTFVDKILCNLILASANSTTLLYVGVVVSLITGVTAVAIRSLATKIVSEDDLGKAQSLFGICEAIAPAIFIPIYNKGIYVNTLDTFPSVFFHLGSIMYGLCCLMIIYMYIREKNNTKPVQEETNGTTNGKSIHMEDIQITHM